MWEHVEVARDANPHVWLVDDCQHEMLLLQSILRRQAFARTRFFTDPRVLVEALKDDLPDIIISDVKMPGFTGFDLCETIRRSTVPALPVVFRSNSPLLEDMEESYRVGGNGYIVKTFDFHRDVEMIRRAAFFFFRLPTPCPA